MREIKFRAWDVVNKKMLYDDPHSSIHRMMTWGGLVYSNGVRQKYELMQYTGLKDKNGKEIYEGDIISAIDFEKTNYKIKFEDGCFIFTNGLRGHQLDYSTIQNFQAEVIGNIYENPELL